MAEELDLTESLRRAVQANIKFYQGWLDLSLEYVRGLSEVFVTSEGGHTADESVTDAGVLVLEGEEGTAARGAFLITNDLSRKVSCQLVASKFTDSDGKAVRPKVIFEPKTLELKPGEQRVVQAEIKIDRKLAAGFGYEGEFTISGMDGIAVPVVLRRQHRRDEMPVTSIEPEPVDPLPRAKKTKAGKTKTPPKKTTAKKTSSKSSTTKKAAPRKRRARQKD